MTWLDVDLPRLRGRFLLPGPPVWPDREPHSLLALRRRGDDGWQLRPASDGADDVDLVGDLVVLCELATGSFEAVSLGRLELPRPFDPADLVALRARSDDLRILMLTEAVADGRLGLAPASLRAAATAGFDVLAIAELAQACLALRQWPRRRGRAEERHPPEVLRGLLDEPRTFREAAGGTIGLVDGAPLKTLRHVVTPTAWTSRRLEALLFEAAGALREASVAERLTEELLRVYRPG